MATQIPLLVGETVTIILKPFPFFVINKNCAEPDRFIHFIRHLDIWTFRNRSFTLAFYYLVLVFISVSKWTHYNSFSLRVDTPSNKTTIKRTWKKTENILFELVLKSKQTWKPFRVGKKRKTTSTTKTHSRSTHLIYNKLGNCVDSTVVVQPTDQTNKMAWVSDFNTKIFLLKNLPFNFPHKCNRSFFLSTFNKTKIWPIIIKMNGNN